MAVKTILTEPNNILRQVSKPVEKVGNEEKQLMEICWRQCMMQMVLDLAAIQIGVPKRIIVMDISKDDEEKSPMYFVNPIIKNKDTHTKIYL